MRNAVHRSRRFFFALALFALLLVLTGWFSRPLYTITDLGTLPDEAFSAASAINGRGDVVGDSQDGLSWSRRTSAFLYHDNVVTQLPQSSPLQTSASAISDNGQATGFACFPSRSSDQAVLFSGGRLHVLGPLPGYTGGFGTGINARGQVIGTMYISATAHSDHSDRAFFYSGGRMTALGLLPGWPESRANGINAAGLVVGDLSRGYDASRAFLYDSAAGKMTTLPTPPGMNSHAHAVNARGDVIGEIAEPNGGKYVALWQNGQVKNLEAPPGTAMSIGAALNDHGQAVGTTRTPDRPEKRLPQFLSYFQRFMPVPPPSLPRTAWVYRDGRMSDLNLLIPRRSGWTLETATGINDRGQIVGSGHHGGRERAFLLTPR